MNQDIRGAYIVCRTPGKPTDEWYHIYPRGEFEVMASIKGKSQPVTLVLDDATFSRIIAAHRDVASAPNWEGYLVGQEHFSLMADRSSEAHAWCIDLEVRQDGLWGRFQKTPLGEHSIGSVYKYRSPVSDLEQIAGRTWRPVNIVDIGLTNKPKFTTLAAAQGRAVNNPEEDAMLERMRVVLGLSTDATEDQVIARVQDALGNVVILETTQQELTDLRTQVLAREADTFVAANKDLIVDTDEARTAVKAQFVAARSVVEATFSGLRRQAAAVEIGDKGAQRVLGRDTATPATTVLSGDADKTRVRAREQEVFVAQVQAEIGCRTRAEARAVAEERKPDLFA